MSQRRRSSGGASSKRGSSRKSSKPQYVEKGNKRYDRHDTYYKKAKAEGYLARSIYKLEEIDAHFKLIHKGNSVLDLGCAPGSWMQYVVKRVDPARGGRAVGVDLLPVRVAFPGHIRIMQADVFELKIADFLPEGVPEVNPATGEENRPFDVVLSDMAPNTTGVRAVDQARSFALSERALEVLDRLLKPGGRFCIKIFEGGDMPEYIKACRARFKQVKIRRPKGVREGSMETYVVGLDYKGPPPPTPDAPDDEESWP